MPPATRTAPLVKDSDNPWKKDPRLGPIPELSEIVKIRQQLQLIQRQAVNSGHRNPLVDLMIRLTTEMERIELITGSGTP